MGQWKPYLSILTQFYFQELWSWIALLNCPSGSKTFILSYLPVTGCKEVVTMARWLCSTEDKSQTQLGAAGFLHSQFPHRETKRSGEIRV
jgi:hypothetical protein